MQKNQQSRDLCLDVAASHEMSCNQCDQIKIAKNDFTRKMIDFDTITKFA